MIHVLGFLANVTSLVLWIPQARITYQNRHDRNALNGISYGTQVIASLNTILWCIYGLMIQSYWLAMGTVIILPLALWTIWLKHSVDTDKLYDLKVKINRTDVSPNELVESDIITGLFAHYQGSKVLVDFQGQELLKKLDSDEAIANYCRKYKIDIIKFNRQHFNDKKK